MIREAAADVSVSAAWSDLSAENLGAMVFDSGGAWQLYRRERSYYFRFATPAIGRRPYKIARFNSAFTSGEVFLNPHLIDSRQPVYPLEYPLDELLILNLLAQGRGVEVHACGLLDAQGNGHLFLGQSGAGKTTMARLWENAEGVRILSDDRIILRRTDNRIWMYGTPWHGDAELAFPARAALSRIYFLRHNDQNQLVPLSGATAVGRLFSCAFPFFYSSSALDFMLAFLAEIVKAVPCYQLSFLPEANVVEFLLAGM